MGGLAFAEMLTPSGQPPQVLRMSTELYQKLSAHFQLKLESIFDKVVVPRDAPAKKDYGDIDFLVRGIKPAVSSADEVWNLIDEILGAKLHLNRGGAHSFGIPYPEIIDAFVQVDVELSPGDGTPDASELFEWTYFMKSDSDLVQIIGISHRPLGLTCNDEGLHVRIEQIEPYNKKKALLFLTRDPEVAIQFFGLDAIHYRKGFTDENDIFDWVISGRFFSPNIFANRVEKSNDRSRQAKRPMYRRFVEEYMPAHMEEKSREWTRNEVLQEALDTFGKHTEYEIMMEEHHIKEAEAQLWDDIRAAITAGSHSKSIALKGLRRWVYIDNGEPRIAAEAVLEGQPPWTTRIPPGRKDDVLTWVQAHWEEVKELEAARAAAARASGTNTTSAS